MAVEFEALNQKRNAYRRGYLFGLGAFLLAWLVRSAVRLIHLGGGLLDGLLIALLVICVGVQAYFALQENLLRVKMQKDPVCREMMMDELVRLNELKAWRTAFFALIGYILALAILSCFVVIQDLMMVLITALLIGFGAYHAAAYRLNR